MFDKKFVWPSNILLTAPKTLENGNPLSLENAHTRRETDANTLKKAINMIIASMTTNKLVACLDPVAS